MPMVDVYYRESLPTYILDDLEVVLPVAVAKAMNTEDAPVSPDDIEIRFRQAGPRDKTLVDLAITVFTGLSHERGIRLKEKKIEITCLTAPLIAQNISFYVSIFLGVSAFELFKGHS